MPFRFIVTFKNELILFNYIILVYGKVIVLAIKEKSIDKIKRLMKDREHIRNICTSAHIHHGKTAFTDNLLASSGLMSAKYAGELEGGMATWQHSDEQERLLTVDAANTSMAHEYEGQEYLVNLIDTPGHVDFGGDVTRAMRAIDGTIVLVCASEGIMPQTETVLKQALRERVKPVLFINKVDRLIKELKLTPDDMQARFMKIFKDFNRLIEKLAEPDFKEKWKVNILDGSVAFGSARDNWAMSVPFMKKKNISFKDILNIYNLDEEERTKWVWDNAALTEVAMDMVVKHLPNPLESQKYRIPKIWGGDPESEFGKDLINCNEKGKVGFIITKIMIDQYGRELSAGRLYSGTMSTGQQVHLNNANQNQKVQQVFIYNGIKPEQVDAIPSGNVIAVSGLSGTAGETVTTNPEEPFEELKHIFEPVITKAIEARNPGDLTKLIEVLRKVGKEDPSIKIEINEETGENLMHGMGELHLEIIENRIKTEKNVEVKTSEPIVVYRESVTKESPQVEGKSPNKHNKFFMRVEPLPEKVYELIESGSVPQGRLKKKPTEIWEKLMEAGMSRDEAKSVKAIYGNNLLMETTKGIVHIGEVIELVIDAFQQVMDEGPLAREKSTRILVDLEDTTLHEDAIHRGPAQVLPAVRDAIKHAMLQAGPILREPMQTIRLDAPNEYLGEISKLVQARRGQVIDVGYEEEAVVIKSKLPVSEMFGFTDALRSGTEGKGYWALQDSQFERIPPQLQDETVKKIRQRKGLAETQI